MDPTLGETIIFTEGKKPLFITRHGLVAYTSFKIHMYILPVTDFLRPAKNTTTDRDTNDVLMASGTYDI